MLSILKVVDVRFYLHHHVDVIWSFLQNKKDNFSLNKEHKETWLFIPLKKASIFCECQQRLKIWVTSQKSSIDANFNRKNFSQLAKIFQV